MVLAIAVLLFQFPAAGTAPNAPQPANTQPVVRTHGAMSIPQPANIQADVQPTSQAHAAAPIAASASAASDKNSAPNDTGKPVLRTMAPLAVSPMANVYLPPPAFRPPDQGPITHRKSWIILSAVEHSAAGFDAWSTRYALSNGRVEADPLMRPFAGSAAIYGSIQAIPIGLDYIAHRFQRSSGWTHRIWWAPQAIASATFLFSASYNVAHTNTN